MISVDETKLREVLDALMQLPDCESVEAYGIAFETAETTLRSMLEQKPSGCFGRDICECSYGDGLWLSDQFGETAPDHWMLFPQPPEQT